MQLSGFQIMEWPCPKTSRAPPHLFEACLEGIATLYFRRARVGKFHTAARAVDTLGDLLIARPRCLEHHDFQRD